MGSAVTITPDAPAVTITPDPTPAPAAPPKFPITPLPGEDFADTMKRAVEAGKSITPEQEQAAESRLYKDAPRMVPTVLTASLLAGPAMLGAGVAAPEAASAAAGGGVLGGAAGGAAGGAGTELINKGLHAAAGENVFTPQSAEDVAKAAGSGALIGGGLGLFGKIASDLFSSKVARGAINESLGATARDVTYGNPAKGILDEGINSPFTGDIEKYKAALRAGASPEQAMQAAGGRAAAVSERITQLAPQVDQALSASTAQIPVADVIDKPLMKAATEIIGNPAMTGAEKDSALTQLGSLQQSLKEGLGNTLSPLQANQIKQAIGGRINWAGNISVTDDVRPAYRAVYGALKQAVNQAVPEVAPVNERLTNLLAAQTDIEKLMKSEEAGMGKGALGSAVTGIARRAEAVMGRAIPAAQSAGQSTLGAAPYTGAVPVSIYSGPGYTTPLSIANLRQAQ
jgi:hypothetical protein